jgi:UDP-N-acetylglucosamine--N-acetylmuramyl-(pentapeptide) pyrophosphoryl-undecaprenol N-acetylglucosamine transferase
VSARRGAVIAGGGTGGHVVPSLEIARALVRRGHEPHSIELYGSRRGHEAKTWPTLEFPFTLLPGRGIRRSLAPTAILANLGAVAGLFWACLRALASFAFRRPRVVVIVGGYASFPAGLAALLTRVPLVAMTTDAVPGAVNGFLGRFAAANAVAFPDTALPRTHVTGTPVLSGLASLDRTPEGQALARHALGLPSDGPAVAAFGGSLGARRINRAVAEVACSWRDRPQGARSLYQVTGRRDYDEFATGLVGPSNQPTDSAHLCYRVVPFEDHMAELYAAADVCVTRAGAMTVAELLIAGVPAILVPLPGAPRDHQTKNAEALVRIGAAVHLPDPDCDGLRLAHELEALLSDPIRLHAMREAAQGLSHPDAAARVAELVDANAR